MLIDTHVHLNFDEFESRLDEIVNDAKDNDVLNMVIIGIDYESNVKAIELAHKYNFYASVGIHPSNVLNGSFDHVKKLISDKRVIAIGETGIDLYWRQDTLDEQRKIFIEHINLAIETGLPLVIHMRNSFEEIYEILKPYQGKVSGVFHSFTLGEKEALKIIDLGFYIGINGVLTFKNAKDLQEAVKVIPLDKIILETDAPYLAPMPYRGKRNEPSFMKFTAIMLARLLDKSYDEIASITSHNAKKLFKIGDNNE